MKLGVVASVGEGRRRKQGREDGRESGREEGKDKKGERVFGGLRARRRVREGGATRSDKGEEVVMVKTAASESNPFYSSRYRKPVQ